MAFETTTHEVLAGVDLTGKVVVVTGVSAGLGAETARALRSAGADVIGTARDVSKAHSLLGHIEGLNLVQLDLADLESVKVAAEGILDRRPRVDVLINNAGVMACPQGQTTQGFETQLGTNHLGHFAWTKALVPALGPGSRIVNLSSRGHLMSGMRWDDPHWRATPYDKWRAYGQSKTANVLFTVGLEKRLAPRGIHAFAVHPGVITTELGRHLSEDDVAALGARPAMTRKTVEQGAATQVWAAVAPELADKGGIYLEDCEIGQPATSDGTKGFAAHAVDPDEAERLWTWSEEQTG